MEDSITLNREQIDAITSPTRGLVYETLRKMRRATAIELGAELGKSPATIHYHLQALIGVGLVREVGQVPSRRRPVAQFEPVGARVSLPNRRDQPELSEAVTSLVVAGLKRVSRDFEQSSQRHLENSEKHLPPHVLRMNVRLNDEDRSTLVAMLEDVAKFASSHQDPDGKTLHWSSILIDLTK